MTTSEHKFFGWKTASPLISKTKDKNEFEAYAGSGKWEVCTAAVHSIALSPRALSLITGLGMCTVCTEAVHSVALWTRTLSQVGAYTKPVPRRPKNCAAVCQPPTKYMTYKTTFIPTYSHACIHTSPMGRNCGSQCAIIPLGWLHTLGTQSRTFAAFTFNNCFLNRGHQPVRGCWC